MSVVVQVRHMHKFLAPLAALILSTAPALATTIAFDGYTLSSDTQLTQGHTKLRCESKIFYSQSRNCYLGFAGDWKHLIKVLEWFLTTQDDTATLKGPFQVMVIDGNTGNVRIYTGTLSKYVDMGRMQYAIGSGTEYALAAMKIGYTAPEAVHMASLLDIYTSDPVTSFHILENKKESK
jgi:ATP-dependent protease HslVU (ClpYQ) peptidase subunit